MKSINPATGTLIEAHEQDSAEVVERKIQRSLSAWATWRKTGFDSRRRRMRRAAELLREREPSLAMTICQEVGKPIDQARAEVRKCAWAADYFADNAAHFLDDEAMESDGSRAFVRFDPLGPILAIMPWNFPFWQVFRFAAPNLMAGNVGLLKHAENTVGCARAIADIFADAGFDEGVFEVLYVDKRRIQPVIDDPRVRGVTLTGSTQAGRAVAARAAHALIPTVLELGGSDPFIVLADCDLDETVAHAVRARVQNNGQSCIAAKRFLVERAVYEAFSTRFARAMSDLVVGDPANERTDVGPLARADLRAALHEQVQASVDAGASLVLGGEIPSGDGFYYPPTVLSGVRPGMAAFDEETFGPVAALCPVDDLDEAVRLANSSPFGLGASIWTRQTSRALHAAGALECGHVAVNGPVKSDPRLPFGGVKHSGWGRELSHHGITEFINKKTIWVA